MYLQALWFIVFVAALAGAWLDATAATVAAAARHAALRAAGLAVERASDQLIESVADQAATGATLFTAPTPSPPVQICPSPSPGGNGACLMWVTTSVVLAGQTAAGSGGANQTAQNLQAYSAIAEQRLAAGVTATVTNGAGAQIAQLTRRVTLRTLGSWPYATLSGSDEPTVDGIAVGDFAGACTGGGCGDDSRVHAVLKCSDPQNPARCNGQGYEPVDQFTAAPWHNADAAASGWSR